MAWVLLSTCNSCFLGRRVRSGSGISAASSVSVDQRLPEEPALEEEQQQLDKKLPGEQRKTGMSRGVLPSGHSLGGSMGWLRNVFPEQFGTGQKHNQDIAGCSSFLCLILGVRDTGDGKNLQAPHLLNSFAALAEDCKEKFLLPSSSGLGGAKLGWDALWKIPIFPHWPVSLESM